MTAEQMVTKFINMVDDELDTDFTYQLLNDAMNEVESEKVWEKLKGSTTFTATSTALPTRFQNILSVVDSNLTEYLHIAMEDQKMYANQNNVYYIDYAADTLNLLQSPNATVTVFYTFFSEDLAEGDTWSFPSWCHSIIPYKMAEIYYAADAGEKSRAWDDRWAAQYQRMLNRMFTWDDRLKVKGRTQRSVQPDPKSVGIF